MEFTLTTHELQLIVLALICNDSSSCKADQKTIEKLTDLFAAANAMTSPDRDYTLDVTIH